MVAVRFDGTLLFIVDHQLELQYRGCGSDRDCESGAKGSNDPYITIRSSSHADTICMIH